MSDIKIIGVAQKEISRRRYAAESLARQLQSSGFNVEIKELDKNFNQYDFVLATRESRLLNDLVEKEEFVLDEGEPKAEGFVLKKNKGKPFIIAGADDSGILYGCLELSEKIKLNQELPVEINLSNAPEFKLRGPCIGIQKPTLLEGRNTYEYPYTPENFPFFYDKEEWLRYLNFLVENRMNTLYLWNGHPFASLLKLEKYPEAQEVSDEILQKNQEIYSFITEEADKRGIWVIQNFYNIFVSKPFAEEHDMETQHRAPTPLLIDYNRECIREFMIKYPHVGLLVCLGEAIRGTENDIEFFREAIIKGVKSGMRELGKEELPPLILRAHASSPEEVMEASLPHYSNLYTMAKFNGESLTTYMPRGRWQDIHLTLSNLGSVHMANVHILANLEPFRYGAQRYIKKCVRAIRDRLG
ncbi:MAG: hypothetical protein ACOC1S_04100 [bacterium]